MGQLITELSHARDTFFKNVNLFTVLNQKQSNLFIARFVRTPNNKISSVHYNRCDSTIYKINLRCACLDLSCLSFSNHNARVCSNCKLHILQTYKAVDFVGKRQKRHINDL
jgi:hypothetical protein